MSVATERDVTWVEEFSPFKFTSNSVFANWSLLVNIFEVWLDNFVDISILYVTYDDKAGEKLAQDIKKSYYWLTSYEVEKLYDILPTSTQSEYEDDYYLVYNKDTKQYNMLPESEGKQHFIVMKYDSVYYRFYIYEYTLNYVK